VGKDLVELTDLILDASALPYSRQLQHLVVRCFSTVQACDPRTFVRSAFVSLHRWAALCATVEGATDEQLARVVMAIEYELTNPDGPNSAPVQNWYLTKANGKMNALRSAIIQAVPKRSVSSGGARPRNSKRVVAVQDESAGPGLSPRGGGGGQAATLPFPSLQRPRLSPNGL